MTTTTYANMRVHEQNSREDNFRDVGYMDCDLSAIMPDPHGDIAAAITAIDNYGKVRDFPTMPLTEVMNLRSGDHGGFMHQFPDGPPNPYRNPDPEEGWWWEEHDYRLVDKIAASMEKDGWKGPPVCIRGMDDEDGYRGPTLVNGHHRTIAAYMVGLTDIPWTTIRADSHGDYDGY